MGRHRANRNGSVALDGHFIVANLVPAVNGRRRVLAARFHPLDRRAEPHRQMTAERFLGIDVQLRAKPAPDFWNDNPQLVLGDGDHARQERPH